MVTLVVTIILDSFWLNTEVVPLLHWKDNFLIIFGKMVYINAIIFKFEHCHTNKSWRAESNFCTLNLCEATRNTLNPIHPLLCHCLVVSSSSSASTKRQLRVRVVSQICNQHNRNVSRTNIHLDLTTQEHDSFSRYFDDGLLTDDAGQSLILGYYC